MRILFTNNTLAMRAGSELYLRDIILALLERGHDPLAFSRRLGDVGRELRAATVPVLDDLDHDMAPPDLIHAQHHLEAMTALARFPKTPAIYVCHGWLPDEEAPPRHPRILRYVAVDELVRQRLVDECGIEPSRIQLHLNFVDLRRFAPRTALPERPARALAFSNYMAEDNCLPALRQACAEEGIQLDAVGQSAGKPETSPEHLLGHYDVVFAKARAAMEAMAAGAAVVLCDRSGLGPLVTPDAFDHLRSFNFGVRLLREAVTVVGVRRQLARYDANAAAEVQRRVRGEAGLDGAVDRLLGLYEDVLAESKSRSVDLEGEARAMARYLRHGPLVAGDFHRDERERLRAEALSHAARAHELSQALYAVREESARHLEALDTAREEAARRIEALERQIEEQRQDSEALHRRLGETVVAIAEAREQSERSSLDLASATAEIDWMRLSVTWRLRERLLSVPGTTSLYRLLTGRGGEVQGEKTSGHSSDAHADEHLEPGSRHVAGAPVQELAEAMIDEHGFLGVPRETFAIGGRSQLTRLLENDLTPGSRVLDIGCGCLRVGYWLVRFLDCGCYCGIEPSRQRVQLGLAYLFSRQDFDHKRPRFDHNATFDTSVFGLQFDYFLAGSIWTHCSKHHIETTLDGFRRHTGAGGVFLVSYLPAAGHADDYTGDRWVGTSHESDTPGVVRHSLDWILDACRRRGLTAEALPGMDCDQQSWLRVGKA